MGGEISPLSRNTRRMWSEPGTVLEEWRAMDSRWRTQHVDYIPGILSGVPTVVSILIRRIEPRGSLVCFRSACGGIKTNSRTRRDGGLVRRVLDCGSYTDILIILSYFFSLSSS